MSMTPVGFSGIIQEIDEARNVPVFETIPGYPAAGGFYAVTGFTTAVVAAALAANTTLMSARHAAASTRRAYLKAISLRLFPVTPGVAGGIPSILGLQRFTAATPSAGTARTVDRLGATKGAASDVTDVRDLNSALTVTSVAFGNLVDSWVVPIMGANITPIEYERVFHAPVELIAGDGLCLRTQNAGPATATWGFNYTMLFFER